jgi:hypothetical protein
VSPEQLEQARAGGLALLRGVPLSAAPPPPLTSPRAADTGNGGRKLGGIAAAAPPAAAPPSAEPPAAAPRDTAAAAATPLAAAPPVAMATDTAAAAPPVGPEAEAKAEVAADSPLPQSHLMGSPPPTALPAAPPTAPPAFSPTTLPATRPAPARQGLTFSPITLRKAPPVHLPRNGMPYRFCRSDCREDEGEDARTLCVSRRNHLELTLHEGNDGFVFAMLNSSHKNGLWVVGPELDAVPIQLAQGQEAVLLPGSRVLLPSSAAPPARDPLVFELVRDERPTSKGAHRVIDPDLEPEPPRQEELPTGKRAREVIDLDPEQDPPWQWPRSIGAVAPAPTSSAARDHLDAMLLAIAKRKGV